MITTSPKIQPFAEVISHPANVTPDWLSRALRSSGNLTRGSVASVAVDACPAPATASYRFIPTYCDAHDDAPATLIGKFATTPEHVDRRRREVFFYRRLAHEVDVPTPAVHFAGAGADQSSFAVLLEERAAGADDIVERALAGIESLASLHGSSWNRHDLLRHQVLRRGDEGHARCICHGSMRPESVLADAVVGWGEVGVGTGVEDVRQLLASTVGPEDPGLEATLLGMYFDAVRQHNVFDLSWPEWHTLYRNAPPLQTTSPALGRRHPPSLPASSEARAARSAWAGRLVTT